MQWALTDSYVCLASPSHFAPSVLIAMQNATYEGYNADHENIQRFWSIFAELSEQQKKNFLCKFSIHHAALSTD